MRAGRPVSARAINQPRELGTFKRLIAAGAAPEPAALADEDVPLKSLVPTSA